ncbi:N-acetylmuramoyl-L-alanine amidase [Enterovirga aerilata]|uniref:N-acetylmuramoyl-L-alanine amidase n=1 Tax=Enterovirga aerilata TaxID=2730920 RepID=A0A849I9K4_9HYPH|nr:N-acetylmuramoyl-L-alanine amidase [Enterovirga sp. DB1703]NNM73089.1 N-acetylmuramoyl-L-alanine amidase [Enterovirga sp. DB1703]
MAHFVALLRGEPDPDLDALEYLYFSDGGTARVGLWGYWDIWAKRACTVKVVSGPGSAKPSNTYGSAVLAFDLKGLTERSVIQAFSGDSPFSGKLECKRGGAGNLAAENKRRLDSGDPKEVYPGAKLVPLKAGFGNYMHSPNMVGVNGLAVHITAGPGKADGFTGNFHTRKVSTHFVIDREGMTAQYVAASLQSQAQGPGNPNFLSVEMVGSQDLKKIQYTEAMTTKQLDALTKLWAWVFITFPAPQWQLAGIYTGHKRNKQGLGMGHGLDSLYPDIGADFASRYPCAGAQSSINSCINTVGLSCHWWLDTALKSCPGVPMFTQLPQVLGFSEYKLASLSKYQLV